MWHRVCYVFDKLIFMLEKISRRQVKHIKTSLLNHSCPSILLIPLISTKNYAIFSSSAQALMNKSLNKTVHSYCLFEITLPQAVLKAFVHLLKLFCTRLSDFIIL